MKRRNFLSGLVTLPVIRWFVRGRCNVVFIPECSHLFLGDRARLGPVRCNLRIVSLSVANY